MKKDDSNNMFNEPVARWAVYREGVDDVIGEYGYSRNINVLLCSHCNKFVSAVTFVSDGDGGKLQLCNSCYNEMDNGGHLIRGHLIQGEK